MRIDLQIIADQIPNNSRVLDVGCGDGTLLAYLTDKKISTEEDLSSLPQR